MEENSGDRKRTFPPLGNFVFFNGRLFKIYSRLLDSFKYEDCEKREGDCMRGLQI